MQAYHLVVLGDSGTGKTTLLRELHDRAGEAQGGCVSIVWNRSGERGYRGERVGSTESARSALASYDSWGDVRLNWVGRELGEVRAFARDLFTRAGATSQILVDEAHEVLPDNESVSGPASGNPLRDGLHKDRDHGIRYIVASQDPMDLYKPPLKQAPLWAVFRPSSFHKGFLTYYNLSDLAYPSVPYRYAVVRPTLPPEIVYQGVTNETYG